MMRLIQTNQSHLNKNLFLVDQKNLKNHGRFQILMKIKILYLLKFQLDKNHLNFKSNKSINK